MPVNGIFTRIALPIEQATGKPFRLHQAVAVGGGCINSAYRLEGDTGTYFIKLNRKERLAMFAAESCGLDEIAATATVGVPRPVCHGVVGGQSYLVMEWMAMRPTGGACDRLLGERLAAMHKLARPFFGWHRDNTIGSTHQANDRHSDWVTFYAQQRLGFQLKLAEGHGFGGKLQSLGERVLQELPTFFASYHPVPSLLHGDLWGGNYAVDESGQPVIFDPACYYGDREADIAMTELFGGFGRGFQAAYQAEYPLDAGYQTRKTLYNLYHILNHLNLFGGGYLGQAESMMARLIAEIR